MTTIVKTKTRRFASAFVAECKANAEPLEPQSVTEGTLACPKSLRNKIYGEHVERLNAVHVAQHRDHKTQSRDFGNRTPTGRTVKPHNPPMHRLPGDNQFDRETVQTISRVHRTGSPDPVIVQFDTVAYFAQPEPKRVTRTQLDGLNADEMHIDSENRLQRGPKKKSIGFGGLRDLLDKQ